jgi:Tol biopolymer transport system component
MGWSERIRVVLLALLIAASIANSGYADERPRVPKSVTFDGLFKRDPVYVKRDGKLELVYSVQQDSVLMVLYRVGLEPRPTRDTKPVRLHPKSRLPEFKPVFSADGACYAYLQSRGNQNVTLAFRKRGDKAEKHFGNPARNPAMRPDGKLIYYSKPGKGGQQIVSVGVDGKDLKWVTESASFNNWPAVSPDGKRILFSSDREDRDLELWLCDADGKNLKRLTKSPARDVRGAWSPDGKRIAFTSSRDGNREVYVMRADGTGAINVSRHPESDDYPAWSPDGKRLVFVGERRGRFDLYEIEVPRR